jgi:hypothetical protein
LHLLWPVRSLGSDLMRRGIDYGSLALGGYALVTCEAAVFKPEG